MTIGTNSIPDESTFFEQLAEASPSEAFWADSLLELELDEIESLNHQFSSMKALPGWDEYRKVLEQYERDIVDKIVDENEHSEYEAGIAKGVRLALSIPGAVAHVHQFQTQSAGADEEKS